MSEESTEKVTEEETVERSGVENPESEKTTREETTVEKPVLNDPEDLAKAPPGAPQAVEETTKVTETHESNDS